MCKKILYSFLLLIFVHSAIKAQVVENFSDGDFTANPAWVGGVSDFIVNGNFQLQSNNSVANSTYYLSTASTMATVAEWDFWVSLDFNPSSANYVDVYLAASASDLSLNSTSGYFVRLGGTDDEISLFRKSNTGLIVKIIDGVDAVLNKSNNTIKIRVVRDTDNRWVLSRDISGTGNSFISEGSVVDATYNTSAYFGFLVKQSTASFFLKHYFDDIEIKAYAPDVTPPVIQNVAAISNKQVTVLFNEPIDPTTGNTPSNYAANTGLGMPAFAQIDVSNPALVYLTFSNPFTNGVEYTLTVSGIKDLAGNQMPAATSKFSFYTPQRYDVVIDELFPDPSPQIGLPLYKYLELRNVSKFPVNLQGWKITDGSSTAILPSFQLMADSFVIVCATNSAFAFTGYGPTLGVSNFPSMNISGGTIVLKSNNDATIHAVQYDLTSYKNDLKKDGGWSIEMIDTKNACAGSENWQASKDNSGGTPGRKNSVDGTLPANVSPKLLKAFAATSNIVTLVFNKTLDSLQLATIANYTFDNGITPLAAVPVTPFFDRVNITINTTIVAGTIYTVKAGALIDCTGGSLGVNNSAKFGLAQDADSMDVIVNEILYNPLPGGVDYIEIYNRSKKIIDLSKVYLANRNSTGSVSSISQVSMESVLLFPGDFSLLTSNIAAVKSQYITTNPDAFIQMNSFPTYSITSGNVILLNIQGNILDEVNYTDKWHFALIANRQGVSLERIDYNGPSVQSNFHSAATSVGYGTPGYKNSQNDEAENAFGLITVTPEVFSPDNDGTDDFVTINYNFPEPGYISNITIFDALGRPVRFLQKSSLSGVKGYYRWDGLGDKNQRLPQGIYIVYTEIFNAAGKTKKFKNTVVLARRF
ncbi:MAG: lamin tail domain-containing protein [Ginsengibacter sp.]